MEFENSDQVITAINELNETELHRRRIKIRRAATKDILSYRKFEMKHQIHNINYECEYQKYNLFVSPINSAIENLTKLVASNDTLINNNATQIKNIDTLINNNAKQITNLCTKIDKVISHLDNLSTEIQNNSINHNPIQLIDIPHLDKHVEKIQ